MMWVNQTILADAAKIAHELMAGGQDPRSIYPVPFGEQFLYLSADRSAILGPNTLTVEGITFYFGFRRSDVP